MLEHDAIKRTLRAGCGEADRVVSRVDSSSEGDA